eukprot:gene5705-6590_t
MGKITNKKVFKGRMDPTGVSSAEGDDQQQQDEQTMIGDETGQLLYNNTYNMQSLVEDPQQLLELIDHPDANERDVAFRTLSELILENTVFNTSTIMRRENLIKIILHFVDPDIQVRVSAIGTISEASDNAFDRVSKDLKNFAMLFKVLIHHSIFIETLVMHISEFLSIITEENTELASSVGNDVLMKLYESVNTSITMSIRLKSLISITLLNIGAHYSRDKATEMVAPILLSSFAFESIPTLVQLSDAMATLEKMREEVATPSSYEVDSAAKSAPMQPADDVDMNEEVKEVEKQSEEVKLVQAREKEVETMTEQWKDALAAQQSAIEIFTNIFSQDDQQLLQPMTDDEDDKFLDAEEVEEDKRANDATPLVKFLSSTALLSHLINVVASVDSADLATIVGTNQDLAPLATSLVLVHRRAVTCLSNLLISYKKEDITQPERVWQVLVQVASKCIVSIQSATFDVELLEMATNSLWSLMRVCPTIGFNTLEESKNIVMLAYNVQVPVKTNLIGMIGLMGQKEMCQPILREIGQLLLFCLNDPSAEIIAESLNSIFDIFAEPHVNTIFKELNMLSVLDSFVPHLRNKIKTDRRKIDRSLLDRLDESRINLTRFIAYKKAQK